MKAKSSNYTISISHTFPDLTEKMTEGTNVAWDHALNKEDLFKQTVNYFDI